MTSNNTPVLFVSHGSPMLALEKENGKVFSEWGSALTKPKAVLIFSAHWETDSLMFGETDDHHELIYDFYGFPKALYDIQYAAPGAPEILEPVKNLLGKENIGSSEQRGLDHGVWVPFLYLWPNADVPILQISLPRSFSNSALFELGQQLAPIRELEVIIAASGTLTHNLREWSHRAVNEEPAAWAFQFDQWVKKVLFDKNKDALLNWEQQAPHAQRNHPTPEHFRPLLVVAGAGWDSAITFPIEGFEYSIFSKRAVQFG